MLREKKNLIYIMICLLLILNGITYFYGSNTEQHNLSKSFIQNTLDKFQIQCKQIRPNGAGYTIVVESESDETIYEFLYTMSKYVKIQTFNLEIDKKGNLSAHITLQHF